MGDWFLMSRNCPPKSMFHVNVGVRGLLVAFYVESF